MIDKNEAKHELLRKEFSKYKAFQDNFNKDEEENRIRCIANLPVAQLFDLRKIIEFNESSKQQMNRVKDNLKQKMTKASYNGYKGQSKVRDYIEGKTNDIQSLTETNEYHETLINSNYYDQLTQPTNETYLNTDETDKLLELKPAKKKTSNKQTFKSKSKVSAYLKQKGKEVTIRTLTFTSDHPEYKLDTRKSVDMRYLDKYNTKHKSKEDMIKDNMKEIEELESQERRLNLKYYKQFSRLKRTINEDKERLIGNAILSKRDVLNLCEAKFETKLNKLLVTN